jgi:hypothetical protein
MDVDLSTDLNALFPLLAPLLSGHSDAAIGTRLARGARVVRGPRREIISRCYNLLLHATLGTGFSDAQCGFKAIRADAARELLPLTNYGNATGTVTADQYGQWGNGSVTVSGTVSSCDFSRGSGYRRGVTEEVFLSGNSSQRGELIGSAGRDQSDQFSGSLYMYNTTSGTITLCAANQSGGNVRDCTSQSFTVSIPQPHPTPKPRPTPTPLPRHH